MIIIIIAVLLIQVVVKAEDYVHSPIQYHSQTDAGTYNYGYDTGLFGSHQFHQEYKDAGGQVRGRYGYTDPYGKLRLVHYTSGPQGYEVISDTEADKTSKPSGRTPTDPVISNVIERYSAAPKAISKAVYTKPVYTKSVPLPTPAKLIISTPANVAPNPGNDKVKTYLAGRDYGEVIYETPSVPVVYETPSTPVVHETPSIPVVYETPSTPIVYETPTILSGRSLGSPVQRLRAAALTGRSVDGVRVHRSVAPDRYKPEFKPPEGYTKCTCV